jgi:aryl-alcohol dehydrogenase-like predicted oxidoreductase
MVSLILGTATFNAGYGISNKEAEFDEFKVRELVSVAQNLGIQEFDTAPGYGRAEEYLGRFLDPQMEPRISSKISSESSTSARGILESVHRTLLQTKTKKLKNVYLHDPAALTGPRARETFSGLRELVSLNLVERIGLSVYDLDSILRARESFPELNTFQVPENICDRRMRHSKDLIDLHQDGVTFNVRSVFLQGLLVMPFEELPPGFKVAENVVQQLHTVANSHGFSPLDFCLAYVKSIPWATGVVVGAASASQLMQTVTSQSVLPGDWESRIDTLPKSILDPREW